jgi:2,3-dihydroxybenzoate-AMP ligase
MMKMLEGFTPYPPEFIARYREAGYWEDRSMADFFAEVCHRFAHRTALVAGNERITYGELDARAERLALHLLELGLRPVIGSSCSSRMYRNSSISTLRSKKQVLCL